MALHREVLHHTEVLGNAVTKTSHTLMLLQPRAFIRITLACLAACDVQSSCDIFVGLITSLMSTIRTSCRFLWRDTFSVLTLHAFQAGISAVDIDGRR